VDERTEKLSDATHEADQRDAQVKAHADRPPTEEEARLADQNELDEKTIQHEKEMAERGVNQKGEGRID
jgi:hypothetical protein